ncbi:MAG TPA: FIST N-terminal domain-containing protein, partial [Acidimicrobiales bacterium]|nr:FIST N-terminal domain-containing protein [Acidimicrobiales bacterium]
MPFASALSEHPVPAFATGEVCGQVLEGVGAHPDLAVVFTTLSHAGALEDVLTTVQEVLKPSVLIGAATDTVIGTGREVEGGAAVSLWAARFGPVVGVRSVPVDVPFTPSALVVVGDPFSVDPAELLGDIAAQYPGLPVVGGMASGARASGATRLALDAEVYSSGLVGALLGPGADVVTLVSQGCRPIGRPFVVTEGEGQIIRSLAGKPPLERLDELAATLATEEIRAINTGGLHIGRVVDERKAEFGPGDFLVRQVIGGDRESGAIAINDVVEVGTTVQFHLRDAAAAHAELDTMLSTLTPTPSPEGALLFSCNGRGARLFGVPDH